ncbi:potassium voltage-gated channel subfamily E member 2-like [Huso huso]|uniref:Potassium voltage-gated channel subfamily E member 2 n=1 Tax=Huso huso TaxID=61971 RepID=A0ABR0ZQL8_HUSHU
MSDTKITNIFEKIMKDYLDERHRNVTASKEALSQALETQEFHGSDLYVALFMGILSFFIMVTLVSMVKSKRREHSEDPYHNYIETDWGAKSHVLNLGDLGCHIQENKGARECNDVGTPSP